MEERGLIDIGNLASWSVSSYKVGLGVEALCEDDPAKYWQSDGPQPHYIDIHFSKRVSVERLSIYTDFGLDESYTPSKIQILSGTGYQSLQEVVTVDLHEPVGWCHVIMDAIRDEYATEPGICFYILLLISQCCFENVFNTNRSPQQPPER